MTIQLRLLSKCVLALAILIYTLNSFAVEHCPRSFNVLERGKGDNYSFIERELSDLHCTNSFEGDHFKIVYSTEDDAISFNHENEAIKTKAANVYYHLSIARDFWLREIKSEYVRKLPQIIVRIDIINAFSSQRHFKHAEQEKNYNNAWTIPEGETPSFVRNGKKWGKEIWFSPAKKIEARKEVESDGSNPVHESLLLVKDPIVEHNKSALIYAGLSLAIAPSISDGAVLNLALKRLAVIAVIYGMLEVTKHMDKWFMDKYYFVDTAMIPDIIYHEFAHIALSDTMKTVHSVPVIEGMADYFATRIVDRKKMYEEIKGFSSNRAKNADSKELYHPYLEGAWNASSDFTLSLLWQGKREFDELNKKRAAKNQAPVVNYDELIFHAHHYLSEESDIANDLNKALIDSCKVKCKGLRTGVNTLNSVFEKKGFN